METSFINELVNKEMGNDGEKLRLLLQLKFCYRGTNVTYLGKLTSQSTTSYFKTKLQSKLQIRNILRGNSELYSVL